MNGARADVVARGARPRAGDRIGIDYGTPWRDTAGRLAFRHNGAHLVDVALEGWDLESTRRRSIPGRARTTYRVPFFGRYEPVVSVERPFGYLVPRERVSVLERIAGHRLETHVLARDLDLGVETYRVLSKEPTASPDVGTAVRTETVFGVEARREKHRARAGDVVVPMSQPWANLAVYLLEPHSDDGLARWGHVDDVGVGDDFPIRRIPGPLALPSA